METVPVLLERRARENASDVFAACGDVTRTFAETYERGLDVAAALHASGVTKGDRVATILPNAVEHIDLIFGCALLGAIHVPVNVFLKGDFLRYQLDDCAP